MKRLSLSLLCLLAVGASSPAAADWLVMRSGDRVETRGAWRIKGSLVVFTLPNGTLSSLRLSEVDLEASRVATEEASRPAPAPAPPRPVEPIAVITDKDIPRAVIPPPSAEGGAADSTAATPSEGTPSEDQAPESDRPPVPEKPKEPAPELNPELVVTTWRQTQADGADVQILGTVENRTGSVVTNLIVTVILLGPDGETIAQSQATVNPPAIAAAGTTNFRALFPGVRSFTNPRFEVRSSGGGVITLPPKAPAASPDA